MERRKAIALAIGAALVVVSLGAAAVNLGLTPRPGGSAALTTVGAPSTLAPGGTEGASGSDTQYVDDYVTVPGGGSVAAAGSSGLSSAAPTGDGPTPGPTATPGTDPTTTAPHPTPRPITTPTPTTPPTTKAPTPTTTIPSGVPPDWPVGKPIPPKPANCIDGQLEDTGIWNCQH
jgi:hypothetical protein